MIGKLVKKLVSFKELSIYTRCKRNKIKRIRNHMNKEQQQIIDEAYLVLNSQDLRD